MLVFLRLLLSISILEMRILICNDRFNKHHILEKGIRHYVNRLFKLYG